MTDARRQTGGASPRRIWTVLAVLVFVVLAGGFLLLRAFYQPFWIPSGSMKPSLLVGDYLFARTLGAGAPDRGDVVLYRNPRNGLVFVARVIAFPGETVRMRDGKVELDGVELVQRPLGPFRETFERQGPMKNLPMCQEPVGYGETCEKELLRETLPDGRSYEVLNVVRSRLDDTPLFTVPDGHVFVMGDNRDNAIDSRLPPPAGQGFIASEDILGRPSLIVFSSRRSLWNIMAWRDDRYFERVR